MIRQLIVLSTLALVSTTFAQTQVPNEFQAGQPARAAEVNANFDALENAVDQNATAIQNIPAGPEGPQQVPQVGAGRVLVQSAQRLRHRLPEAQAGTPAEGQGAEGCQAAAGAFGNEAGAEQGNLW